MVADERKVHLGAFFRFLNNHRFWFKKNENFGLLKSREKGSILNKENVLIEALAEKNCFKQRKTTD
jgi:hypothetical protein